MRRLLAGPLGAGFFQEVKLTRNVIALATADTEFGHVPADTAKEEAKTIANEERKAVTLRDPVTDEVLGKVKPSAKKPAKAKAPSKPKATAKPAKAKAAAKKPAAKAKPAKESKPKSPRGMVVEILKLASRAKGVSPAELNELTKWKGAPWKWLFANPKKTGYCDRWGYKLTVLTPETGGVRYQVAKR
jgi:hypothetical protein